MSPLFADFLIARYRWIMLLGLLLLGLSRVLDGFGLITGWMAIWLGASGGSFGQYRKDSGLWMLSGLFLMIVLPGFAVLACGPISDIARAHVPSPSDVDLWGTLFFLAVHVLFLTTVTRKSWSLRKSPVMPES